MDITTGVAWVHGCMGDGWCVLMEVGMDVDLKKSQPRTRGRPTFFFPASSRATGIFFPNEVEGPGEKKIRRTSLEA